MSKNVYFYVNGRARLLMACVIADELYPDHQCFLILLNQYDNNYEALLPHVRDKFQDVYHLNIRARKYSHLDQGWNTYFNPYLGLRRFFRPHSEVVLFGIRSPPQKFIIRHNKAIGNTVKVFAESLAVDRIFQPREGDGVLRSVLRKVFARAFDYQHNYDVFYVFNKEMYRGSPAYPKLANMFDLYASRSFSRYAELLTSHLQLDELACHDPVFFGQPMSNFDNVLERQEEEALLKDIVGNQRVLVLPHPNEILGSDNKYRVLPNAQVFRSPVPNDLLLARLRPRVTITYSSTIGMSYAMNNGESMNYFHPVFQSDYEMLMRFKPYVPNIEISNRHILADAPHWQTARKPARP